MAGAIIVSSLWLGICWIIVTKIRYKENYNTFDNIKENITK